MIYKFYKIMFVSLLLTITIELLMALLIGIRRKKDFINIILVNIITNPIVVLVPYIISLYNHELRIIVLIVLELLAIIIEGCIYKKVLQYKKINYLLISVILNLSSYLIGEILNRVIW